MSCEVHDVFVIFMCGKNFSFFVILTIMFDFPAISEAVKRGGYVPRRQSRASRKSTAGRILYRTDCPRKFVVLPRTMLYSQEHTSHANKTSTLVSGTKAEKGYSGCSV